jgi:UMF1 family MFS transporter
MGGIADRGALPFLLTRHRSNILETASYRKPLLFGFAALGSISSVCFLLLPSSSPVWPLSGLLSILANIGFSASIVVLNSYLPRLAASSLPSSDHGDTEKLSRATARISSLGIALGYTAGILFLLAVLFPVQLAGGSTKALRFAIAGSGAWWALFSVPALLFLPSASASQERLVAAEREGLLADERPEAAPALAAAEWTVRQEVVDAWKRLGSMLRWHNIQRLRNTFRYLAAWFLLSDGIVCLSRSRPSC